MTVYRDEEAARRQAGETLPHYVSDAPLGPHYEEPLTPEQERYYLASQWRIMWWKLRRHKLAVISGAVLLFFYLSIAFVEVLAPYHLETRNTNYIYAPPQTPHLFHEGQFVGPFVYGWSVELNLDNHAAGLCSRTSKIYPCGSSAAATTTSSGASGRGDFHLVCPAEDGVLFLLRH